MSQAQTAQTSETYTLSTSHTTYYVVTHLHYKDENMDGGINIITVELECLHLQFFQRFVLQVSLVDGCERVRTS